MDSVPQKPIQSTFDFEALSLQPVPEVVLHVTHELIQDQNYWWSDLEYRTIPNSPGIYCIVNTKDQSFYVGSATSLKERKHHHFRDLRAENHKNSHLQRAYNRDGMKSFRFCLLEHVKHVENLLEREQHFIDTLDPHYNIARTAGSNLGMTYSDDTKSKMSAARRAHPKMLEQMEKLNADRTGKPLSPEHCATISKNQTGRKLPESTKAKISAANKGKKKPDGHGEKVRAAKLGKPRDAATIEKVSATKRANRLAKQQNQPPLF